MVTQGTTSEALHIGSHIPRAYPIHGVFRQLSIRLTNYDSTNQTVANSHMDLLLKLIGHDALSVDDINVREIDKRAAH